MKRTPQSTITTALIYTRVSTDEQAREGISLDVQLAECRRYCAAHGWVIGGEYQDILSGRRDDRRDYQRLLADVRRMHGDGRTVVVVVAALDRFGRKLLERVRCREELKGLGVQTHSAREGGEVSDVVANVLAAVAEEEVRRLGERVRAVNQHIAAGGWHHVGWAPWGYAWRPATDDERARGSPNVVLEIDEVAAPYVLEAFERLARGDSMRSVSNWLAGLPERARAGRKMRYTGVYVILQTRTYIGQLPDGRAGRWPALIDARTWERAQVSLARHKHLPKQASRNYLLTGFLRCERCDSRMGGWNQVGRDVRYRCMGYQQGVASPDLRCYHNMRCEQVDGPLLAEVAELVDTLTQRDPRVRAELRERWQSRRVRAKVGDPTATIRQLEQEADKSRERLTNAAVLLVDGTIDKAGYERLRDKAQADLEAAEAEIARLTGDREVAPALPPLGEVLALAGSWGRVLTEGSTAARRDVLAHLIRTVTPKRLRRDTFSLSIEWTLLGEMLRRAAREIAA